MKTVLVTGCSSGVGRATAAEFLRREWTVYATARDADALDSLDDAGCATAELDVTDSTQVRSVVDRAVEETGRVDCLVNNAGYAQFGPVEDVSVGALSDQFDVNVYGPQRLARAVLPHMRERGEGTIVNVSSVAGRLAAPMAGAYASSKHALEALSDALRNEVAPQGIDVVVVQPGSVETGFGERATTELARLDRTDAYADLYRIQDDRQLLGGGGTVAVSPSQVARTIADAASTSDPDPRYPVGAWARVALLARHLPDRWRDSAYRLVRWVLS